MLGRLKLLAAVLAGATLAGSLSAQTVELVRRGTFASNAVAGSEIVAHDPASERLFVTNGATNRIDVLSIANVDAPTLVRSIDVSAFGVVNSVAVSNGLVAVALANTSPTTPGVIALYTTEGVLRRIFAAGVLPDHVSFSPNGRLLLSANEGEPVGTFGQPTFVDPRGSVTMVDLSPGIDKAIVTQIDFTSFDGRENELRARGVRIFPTRSASRDLEPEFIAVSPDNTRAFVTLQEANSFAVLDLTTRSVLDIVPAGLKNHNRGLPSVDTVDFPALPLLGTTPAGQPLFLGGFSGLWFEGIETPTGRLRFATIPDRGPNGEPTNTDADPALERPFALPSYQPRVVRFTFNPATREIQLGSSTLLTRADGTTPLTGLPNIAGVDEEPVDLNGQPLPYDPFGADLEGLVITPDGDHWMVDEYRPAIYRFNSTGTMLARYVPAGTGVLGGQAPGFFGTETLPAEYSLRRANRGFEGVAFDSDAGILYAFIQTSLANPNLATSAASKVIRMIGINPTSGAVVAEYVYPMDKTPFREQNTDKIGDAVYAGGGQFFIVERDDSEQRSGKKMLFQFNLKGATNLRGAGAPALLPNLTLEQHSLDQLVQAGIRVIGKNKVANLPSLGYFRGDKLEGIALLNGGELALINDNDFGIAPIQIPINGSIPLDVEPTPIQLGFVRFTQGTGLDASDRDGPNNTGALNIANWPVFGMHMPDSIASFSAGGLPFYVSAGEGDDRGEVVRAGAASLILDPATFPNAAALKGVTQLGRLNVSAIDGDPDGDGDRDQLQVLGSRSFALWDQFGNLVYDSGDMLERVTAATVPGGFNSDHEANQSFDTRSDNKGPEPEAIAVGTSPDGRTYAFVGLERIGGVAVFDVTNPYRPRYMTYANNRDYSVVINLVVDPDAAGDLGPEGITFIPASAPNRQAMIAVANEISGTTTIYTVVERLLKNGFE